MADFQVFTEGKVSTSRKRTEVPPDITTAINSDLPQYSPPKPVPKHDWAPESGLASLERPGDILDYFLPVRILELIVHETNRRAAGDIATSSRRKSSATRCWHPVTVRELKRFIGVSFWLSLYPARVLEDAWRSPNHIGKFIGRVRWQQINRFLSLNADDVGGNTDAWFWKIRPVINEIREILRSSATPSSDIAVDEEVIKFLGRSLHTVMIKTKPDPIGFKVWCFGSGPGYIHDFLMHSLQEGPEGVKKSGIFVTLATEREALIETSNRQTGKQMRVHLAPTQAVVYRLCQRMRAIYSQRVCVFLDNLFTTLDLCKALIELDVATMGVVRTNNTNGVPSILKTIHSKYESAVPFNHVVARNVDGVLTYLWHDSKLIMCMTTAFDNEKIEKLRKRPGKKRVEARKAFGNEVFRKLEIPQANDEYNNNMNKVDVASQLAGNLSSHHEQQYKWWRVFFWWLIDTVVNNSYLVWKRQQLHDPGHRLHRRFTEQLIKAWLEDDLENEIVHSRVRMTGIRDCKANHRVPNVCRTKSGTTGTNRGPRPRRLGRCAVHARHHCVII